MAKTQDQKEFGSERQAEAQLESIKEMVAALNWFDDNEPGDEGAVLPQIDGYDIEDQDKARERIQEDALSVQVRYGWFTPGHTAEMLKSGPEEFEILLCTGGPACRIIGKLSQYNEPESASIEHQDWGTPWTRLPMSGEDEDIVLTYCRQFYFGE